MPATTDLTRLIRAPHARKHLSRENRARLSRDIAPQPVPLEERIRKLPEALLLTTGYYASRAPWLSELLKRTDFRPARFRGSIR
jgi:hypothetical protein